MQFLRFSPHMSKAGTDPSLNTDVPYAGPRPRNGPPVSLFR